jgi:hypothetical protein
MFGGGMPEIHQMPAGGPRTPTPSGWAEGLSRDKAAEWLVDCYRMRVDDDYAWGGVPLPACCRLSTSLSAYNTRGTELAGYTIRLTLKVQAARHT